MKIKTWFFDKIYTQAKAYNMFIDTYERAENGMIDWDAETQLVRVLETLGESEKAIKVKLNTGSIVGSGKGWTCWIPKSCIVA